jgi:hypothetical protein
MLSKTLSVLFCIFLTLVPTALYAQNIPVAGTLDVPLLSLAEGEHDVGDALSPMRMGQRAPFTGVLVSNHAVAILLVDRLSLNAQCRINTDHELGVQQAENQLSLDNLQAHIQTLSEQARIEHEASSQRITNLTNSLNRVQGNPISGLAATFHTVLWVSGGLVAGTLIGLLIGLVVK